MKNLIAGGALALALAQPLWAVEGEIEQVSPHVGEMMVRMGSVEVEDRLRFEPYQMLDDLFTRNDYVLLMRHGPTDWSKRDIDNVAPTDCENQRVLSDEGHERMFDLGVLLGANDLVPGKIVVSEWCRNQETLTNLLRGLEQARPGTVTNLDVETDPGLNLLLSLQGAPNVEPIRGHIDSWTGEDSDGPLLIISHFTNIEELTTFNIYEGEMLMIDPTRDDRVLGYLRLRSAAPDVGHFTPQQVAGERQ
ncbi:MAG: hypothetical protein AAFU80_18825 [Pseudomonadota bacterium]